MATSRVIGLDIGTTAVRAAEVDLGRNGSATLVRLGQQTLPLGAVRDGEVADQAVVSGAIKRLWSDGKFSSRNVAIGVGNQRVVVRDVDLPWLPPAQLKASLPFQVQDLLPISTDDVLLDYYPSSEYDGPQGRAVHGMLVAAQRDTVGANVLAVESAGLRPMVVDLNAFALLRSLVRGDLQQRTVALVDIGARLTNVVVSELGRPQLVRIVPMGGQHVTDAVAHAMSISAPDAEQIKRRVGIGYAAPAGYEAAAAAVEEVTQRLVEAIRSTITYFSTTYPQSRIETVVLTGGGVNLPGLGQYLSSVSRLPAVLGNPVAGLTIGKSVQRQTLSGHESELALPLGLAYGAAA